MDGAHPLEYRPRDVPPELFSKTMLGDFSRRTPWVSSPSTTLGWQQLTWQGRRIRLQISTPEATVLTLQLLPLPAERAGLTLSLLGLLSWLLWLARSLRSHKKEGSC